MINTKRFINYNDWLYKCKDETMNELNQFIEENKIERPNILEFRTNRTTDWKCHHSFEVIISWWQ